ncbi:MAG: cystathionine gamma-synthase [Kiritimatiellia bacterium]|jgi:cystathionine gamma-synthase
MSQPRTCIRLPEVEDVDDFSFEAESVTGPYGVTMHVAAMQQVVDWQEKRTAPYHGYYRLILPPVVKTLQARIKARYNAPVAIMYRSAEIALKEVLEYLWLTGARTLRLHGTMPAVNQLPFSIITEAADVELSIGEQPAPDAPGIRVTWASSLPDSPIDFNAIDYCIGSLKPVDAQTDIDAAAVLTRHVDEAAIIHERNRRRGACVCARDAAWLLGKDTTLSPEMDVACDPAIRLRELEEARFCTLYPSGMCAITVVLDHIRQTRKKSHFVVVGHPYSDTHLLVKDMDWAGIPMQGTMLAGEDVDGLKTALEKGDVAGVIVETISNPLSEVPDLEALVKICRSQGVPTLCDNTMATPYNCRPLTLGIDYVVHSTTKYLSGSNDHGGGAILTNDPATGETLTAYQHTWGLRMSPLEAKTLAVGLEDFEARMERFNANGQRVAEWLATHPMVEKVFFSGLPSSPDYPIAQRLLKPGMGSVVSFVLKRKTFKSMQRFYDCPMPGIKKAPSLGSNITLVCPYTMLTYYPRSDDYLAEHRLERFLIRISVGSEQDIAPIIQELDLAIQAADREPVT